MSLDATVGGISADTYGTLAEALAYHRSRNNTDWLVIASDELRERLMRQASDFMTDQYAGMWKGTRVTSTQRLDWPRFGVEMIDQPAGYGSFPAYIDQTIIPEDIKNAQFELALISSRGPLAPDVERLPIKEKVDVIEVTYEASAPAFTIYRIVAAKLSKYCIAQSMTARVVRT